MHAFLRHCKSCFGILRRKKPIAAATNAMPGTETPTTITDAGGAATTDGKMDETMQSTFNEGSLLNNNVNCNDTNDEATTVEAEQPESVRDRNKFTLNETERRELERYRAAGGASGVATKTASSNVLMCIDLDSSVIDDTRMECSTIEVNDSTLLEDEQQLAVDENQREEWKNPKCIPFDVSNEVREDVLMTTTTTTPFEKAYAPAVLNAVPIEHQQNFYPKEANNSAHQSFKLQYEMTSPTEVESTLKDVSVLSHVDMEPSEIVKDSIINSTQIKEVLPNLDEYVAEEDCYEMSYFQSSLIELGRRCWPSTPEIQHYTKGCLWSPDGTCLLVPVHMDGMHVIELPLDLYDGAHVPSDRQLSDLKSAVHIAEGGTVYDFTWYPHMNSTRPETCFWIATRQHEPILMWDAFDGKLRCTFSGYDDVDEVEAAISLSFSNDGSKIFAGYKKSIKIFDTNRPGRTYDNFPVKRAISCIAQTSDKNYALTCGNWNGYIQHFDLRSPKLGALFTLGGHHGGITHLRYSTVGGGEYLFSGARKDTKILQWDLRNYEEPVKEYPRTVATNQRIYFDLSPQQQWLASGDTEGKLHVWNINAAASTATDADTFVREIELPLHGDCCNGINFHPMRPILATSSGQYHFFDGDNAATVGKSSPKPIVAGTQGEKQQPQPQPQPSHSSQYEKFVAYENALLLLWFGA